MSAIVIRPARAGDKDAVLAFTQNTWTWGDYISYVWDEWLAQSNGELAVADVDGVVAGMTMTTILPSREAWLQGLRVHPNYRRHGLARLLTAHQLDFLRGHGVPVVRLAVHAHNVASQTHVARMGFRRVTSFIVREYDVASGSAEGAAERLGPGDGADAWQAITGWPAWQATAGLWARHWTWHALDEQTVAEHIAQGEVSGVRDAAGRWAALAIALPDDDRLYTGYAGGAGPAVAALARALATQARQQGKEEVTAMLPPVPEICESFEQASYVAESDGSAMYIYALDL